MKKSTDNQKKILRDTKLKRLALIIMMLAMLAAVIVMSTVISNADSYYTIRINYVFAADGSPAHDPYIAAYPAGEPLDVTVTNPVIDGYVPKDGQSEDALLAETTHFETDPEAPNQNQTKTVYYFADEVKYEAWYYKQNIYDDLYKRDKNVPKEATERYGKTGSNPTILETYSPPGYEKGFKNLFHEPEAIAADGSTVFRIYFDRNYFSVNFDLGNEGYGVEPIYAKYETAFHIEEPKRQGYKFAGWARTSADSSSCDYGYEEDQWHYLNEDGTEVSDEIKNDIDPSNGYFTTESVARGFAFEMKDGTVPDEDTFYRAIWIRDLTKYSVIYWLENADAADLTEAQINDAHTIDDARALIGQHYTPVAVKEVDNVPTGTQINLNTVIQNKDGDDMRLQDFFDYDLTENGDFPEMSAAQRKELEGNKYRYYELNGFLSDLQFNGKFEGGGHSTIEVTGDGKTRINVYYKRKVFSLKFFFAKTTGGTISTDNDGYYHISGTNVVGLTSGTKKFSRSTSTNLQAKVDETGWSRTAVADDLPQISEKRRNIITPDKIHYLEDGNKKWWYYELSAKYGASLKNIWFSDAFQPFSRKDKQPDYPNEIVYFGSWAVENGTVYKANQDAINNQNFTVKGRYEQLTGKILFTENWISNNGIDPTNLSFVASWDNTGGESWNDGVKTIYNFTYKNYVELLPLEHYILTRVTNGEDILLHGGAYPGCTDYSHPEYTDGQPVTINEDTYAPDEFYTDIIMVNGKYYGLLASNVVETMDGGSQYTSSSTFTLSQNVKKNQTAVEMTGFKPYEVVQSRDTMNVFGDRDGNFAYQYTDYRNSAAGETKTIINTGCDNINPQSFWYDQDGYNTGFTASHHCDVLFFYNRKTYKLEYISNNESVLTFLKVYYGAPLDQTRYQLTPSYTPPELSDYYNFVNWYHTPYYYREVVLGDEYMPDDDKLFYAKWEPRTIDVAFYRTYDDYYFDRKLDLGGEDVETVDYGSYVKPEKIPSTNNNPNNPRPYLNPPEGANFAGWYYIDDDGAPQRFEPEKKLVTAVNSESSLKQGAKLKLFAEWVTKTVAKYKISYVEKDNPDVEVAPPTTGRAYVYKTKTFEAKSGAELNEDHAWSDDPDAHNWWPVANSHSILVKDQESGKIYEPNVWAFEYIQKPSVHYKVRYLLAGTTYELIDSDILTSTHASIKADAKYIEGYVAEEATLTKVLAASTAATPEEQEQEELANNVITFYYSKNKTDYLYGVEYYLQNLEDDDYPDTPYQKENLLVSISDPTVSVADLYSRPIPQRFTANGYAIDESKTVRVTSASPDTPESVNSSSTCTVEGENRSTFRLYFSRKTYPYSYQYVDMTAEKNYLEAKAANENTDGMWDGVLYTSDPQPAEKVDTEIDLTEKNLIALNYTRTVGEVSTPYTRIGADTPVTLTIVANDPDENNNTDPSINRVKVYYKKDTERELQYKMICVNSNIDTDYDETGEPLFGGVSAAMQTVDEYDKIQNVTFYDFNNAEDPNSQENEKWIHLHWYNFLGWYSQPVRGENDANRITENKILTKTDLNNFYGLQGELPGRDQTVYYALVEQKMVKMDIDFVYVDIEGDLPATSSNPELTAYERDQAARAYVDAAYNNRQGTQWSPDGEFLGSYVDFSAPSTYENHADTPYHKTSSYDLTMTSIDGRVYRYQFREWWKVHDTPEDMNTDDYGKLERMNNWNNGTWGAEQLKQQLKRDKNLHFLAVFTKREITELPYTINYQFTDRGGTQRTYVKKGTLQLKDEADRLKYNATDTGAFELTDEFILQNAPYESNYAERLVWSDAKELITKTSVKGDSTVEDEAEQKDRIITYVTSVQTDQEVHAVYSTTPGGDTATVSGKIGDNYKLNEGMLAIEAEETYDGKSFAYWEVRKSANTSDPVIAKSYSPLFDLCLMDNYWLTPVYEDEPNETPDAAEPSVVLTHIGNTRNTWTDNKDEVPADGSTDILYTDFEIAFENGAEKIFNAAEGTYSTGVVFELCATVPPNVTTINPAGSYVYSDPDALKAAIVGRLNKYEYDPTGKPGKTRNIQISEIPQSALTNRDRVQYGKGYKNTFKYVNETKTYINANYLLKATAYLKKGDDVWLSNSVYLCMKDVGLYESALESMIERVNNN